MGAVRQRCGRRRICIWAVAGREAVQHVDSHAGWRLGCCIVATEGLGWAAGKLLVRVSFRWCLSKLSQVHASRPVLVHLIEELRGRVRVRVTVKAAVIITLRACSSDYGVTDCVGFGRSYYSQL